MANGFSQTVDIFFEKVVEGFEANNIAAKHATVYRPNSGRLEESGGTFYRPMGLMTEVVDGRDVSSSYKDLTELTVPATLTDAHIRNVPVKFTGSENNNPHILERLVDTSVSLLSNKVNQMVIDAVATYGTQVVTSSSNIDSYDEAAQAEAIMNEQQVSKGTRSMILNPRMGLNLAGNLAGRQTFDGSVMSAYERSKLPMIGGFSTFTGDYGKSITGSSASGYLVNGASQVTTPVSKDANDLPVDNRTQTLTVDTGTGAAAGDSFTIADVYSVGHINKESTGQLKTFRILSIDGADWTIAPAIIPADGAADSQAAYGNVDTSPADNAAITVLNTTTKASSVFYNEENVEILTADYNIAAFGETGKKIRTATTDSGIQIVMMGDSDIDTLVTSYRLFIWANATMTNYEAGGILLEGQA